MAEYDPGDQQGLAVPPPPPVLDMAPPEVEKPNPLMRVLAGIAIGGDPLGRRYAYQQHAAEEQFWKQQKFAEYQLSQRETLSHDFDAIGEKFFSSQAALNKARTELAVQKSMGAPPETLKVLEQNVSDLSNMTMFLQQQAMAKTAGIEQIDNSMGPMIAHMTPPPGAFGGGAQQGASSKGGAAGTAGAAGQPSDMTQTTPPKEEALPAPEHWQQILESPGVGFSGGKIVNGRVQYMADSTDKAKRLQKQLDNIQSHIPGGLEAPVDIIDMEAAHKDAKDFSKELQGQMAQAMNKASYYQGLLKTNPKTAQLQFALDQAVQMGDDERAKNLSLVVNATEEERKTILRDIAQKYEDVAAAPQRRIAELAPLVDAYGKDLARRSGIETLPTPAPSGGTKTTQGITEFGREFAQNQGWDYNTLSPQQKQTIVERWQAARARQASGQ